MKKFKAIITGGKDMYGVWIEGQSIYSAGETIEELKSNLKEAIEGVVEFDGELPEELRTGDYEIEYIFDITALLRYYSNIISFAGLSKLTGINNKQLWNYANGYSVPRKATAEKIFVALKDFVKEFDRIQVSF